MLLRLFSRDQWALRFKMWMGFIRKKIKAGREKMISKELFLNRTFFGKIKRYESISSSIKFYIFGK